MSETVFLLTKHPSEITLANRFDPKLLLRKDGQQYWLKLDSGNPVHVKQFAELWKHNEIDLASVNGHCKDLAGFDAGFALPEVSKLLGELKAISDKIPKYREVFLKLQAEAEVIKAEIGRNDDPTRVPALLKGMREKRDEAEAAEITAQTAERARQSLTMRIKAALEQAQENGLARDRVPLDEKVKHYNSLADQKLQLGREIAEDILNLAAKYPGRMYREVYITHPEILPEDGRKLKLMQAVFKIESRKDMYRSVLVEVK
jgi:hypothetical protein